MGENNRQYYVWQAFGETRHRCKRYIEGPAAISWSLSSINIRIMANTASTFIRLRRGRIFMVGWSRGAAACIQVALDLKRSGFNRTIEAMFLFDAVDPDGSTGDFLNLIPSNVDRVYHAIATRKGGIWGELFPTCGRREATSGTTIARNFDTTHGGIAGADDEVRDAGSRRWMWEHLRTHRVI